MARMKFDHAPPVSPRIGKRFGPFEALYRPSVHATMTIPARIHKTVGGLHHGTLSLTQLSVTDEMRSQRTSNKLLAALFAEALGQVHRFTNLFSTMHPSSEARQPPTLWVALQRRD